MAILNNTGTLYGITPGANAASKAVILDKNSKVDSLDMTEVKIGGTAVTATAAELNALDGIPAGASAGNIPVLEEVTFTEDGDTTYTGSVTVPAGAYILDIIVSAVALWDDGTSAAMIVGDVADPNGWYDAVDLKATDLILGETLSFSRSGGVGGAYVVSTTHVEGQYNASARVITGVITTGGQNGTAGRTRMAVLYCIPTASVAVGV